MIIDLRVGDRIIAVNDIRYDGNINIQFKGREIKPGDILLTKDKKYICTHIEDCKNPAYKKITYEDNFGIERQVLFCIDDSYATYNNNLFKYGEPVEIKKFSARQRPTINFSEKQHTIGHLSFSYVSFNNYINFVYTKETTHNDIVISSEIVIPSNIHFNEILESIKLFVSKKQDSKIGLLNDAVSSLFWRFKKADQLEIIKNLLIAKEGYYEFKKPTI